MELFVKNGMGALFQQSFDHYAYRRKKRVLAIEDGRVAECIDVGPSSVACGGDPSLAAPPTITGGWVAEEHVDTEEAAAVNAIQTPKKLRCSTKRAGSTDEPPSNSPEAVYRPPRRSRT